MDRRRSVRPSACPPVRLPLAELESLPCSRTTGLLSLDRARIAGHEAGGPELEPVLAIGLDERPGDAMPQGAGLSGLPATGHVRLYVERTEGVGCGEGLLNVLHQ